MIGDHFQEWNKKKKNKYAQTQTLSSNIKRKKKTIEYLNTVPYALTLHMKYHE